ncbi:MAG: hypothetical protein DRN53_05360 [Thermoprotei archaeon]|nr:MAG: hypothetical protein DRN53_05360 [Thermoprotei archaeon]
MSFGTKSIKEIPYNEIVEEARKLANQLGTDFSKTALRRFHWIASTSMKEKDLQRLNWALNNARVQLAYFVGRRGGRGERQLFNYLDAQLREVINSIEKNDISSIKIQLRKIKLFLDALVAFTSLKRGG